jgi:Rab9 effector protein with kelch motifs
LYKDKILLFGGQLNKEILSNDTFSYNLSNSTWQLLLCTGEIPTKRISHSSVIYSDYMVVFGGFFKILTQRTGYHESQMRYCSCNSLNILNLRTLKWSQGETTGQPPCERQCHSSVVHQGDMYVFGGYAGNSDVVLNDMYKLNLDGMYWSQIEYFGHFIPLPRYYHCASVYMGKMVRFPLNSCFKSTFMGEEINKII